MKSLTMTRLRSLYIDRIYDTYIDETQLQDCDFTIGKIADGLEPRPYSSRAFIREMGKWLRRGQREERRQPSFSLLRA